jgi:hypothetical protein
MTDQVPLYYQHAFLRRIISLKENNALIFTINYGC